MRIVRIWQRPRDATWLTGQRAYGDELIQFCLSTTTGGIEGDPPAWAREHLRSRSPRKPEEVTLHSGFRRGKGGTAPMLRFDASTCLRYCRSWRRGLSRPFGAVRRMGCCATGLT